jgi:putative FmdB family regulatory protein
MPVYEYACTGCGERTEARQSFSDPPLEECTNCGGKLRKLYSPVGIVFKGSGFYATDARKAPADKKVSSDGEAASTKTSETKKASKGDAGSGDKSSGAESKPAAKPAGTSTGSAGD